MVCLLFVQFSLFPHLWLTLTPKSRYAVHVPPATSPQNTSPTSPFLSSDFKTQNYLFSLVSLAVLNVTLLPSKMYEEPTKPETPDYYFDLGVAQDATKAEIKRAFHNLALLHHPDKKAPGESIDAAEFRQVRIAKMRRASGKS